MMKILLGILIVILSITLAAVLLIGLYIFWFKAVPEFWKEITKKQKDE